MTPAKLSHAFAVLLLVASTTRAADLQPVQWTAPQVLPGPADAGVVINQPLTGEAVYDPFQVPGSTQIVGDTVLGGGCCNDPGGTTCHDPCANPCGSPCPQPCNRGCGIGGFFRWLFAVDECSTAAPACCPSTFDYQAAPAAVTPGLLTPGGFGTEIYTNADPNPYGIQPWEPPTVRPLQLR